MDCLGYPDLPWNSHPLCHLVHRRSVHLGVHRKSSLYSDLSPSQPFGHQPVEPRPVHCVFLSHLMAHSQHWTLRSRLPTTASSSSNPRASITSSDYRFVHGYVLSRLCPPSSCRSCACMKSNLRVGCQAFFRCFCCRNSNKQYDQTSPRLTAKGKIASSMHRLFGAAPG